MALIKCSECSGSLSEAAKACPHCGNPAKKPTSRLTIFFGGLVALGIFFSISKTDRPHPAPTTHPIATPIYPRPEISSYVRAQIRERSKDSDSLKFRNEFTPQEDVYCGEVNGKNSFGAYSGFVRFIGNGKTLLMDDSGTKAFNTAWEKFCVVHAPA